MEQNEESINILIAEHTFSIHSLYDEVYFLCRKYLTDKQAEEEVFVSQEDIEAERKIDIANGMHSCNAYLETIAVQRKISELILKYDTFLMHGAVIAHNEKAYMFTAASGTGKTTHILKWLENLDNAYVVNGDKPLIKITEKEAIACGTPWRGKEKLGRNCMVPLKAIVLMERGENNEINEVTFEKALTFLLRQTYMPTDGVKMKKTLALVAKLKGRIKFYKYVFNNMKDDAFEVAYGTIVEENR